MVGNDDFFVDDGPQKPTPNPYAEYPELDDTQKLTIKQQALTAEEIKILIQQSQDKTSNSIEDIHAIVNKTENKGKGLNLVQEEKKKQKREHTEPLCEQPELPEGVIPRVAALFGFGGGRQK